MGVRIMPRNGAISLTVSSTLPTGPTATAQSPRLGFYLLTKQRHNNFPVYEKKGGGQFIFVTDVGFWGIYSELLEHSELKRRGGIFHEEKNPTPSSPPVKGWSYNVTVAQTGQIHELKTIHSKHWIQIPSSPLIEFHSQSEPVTAVPLPIC